KGLRYRLRTFLILLTPHFCPHSVNRRTFSQVGVRGRSRRPRDPSPAGSSVGEVALRVDPPGGGYAAPTLDCVSRYLKESPDDAPLLFPRPGERAPGV